MLLNIIKGPKSYENIRTVADILHPTFQSACNAHGLLGNDEEWITALEEATLHATSYQMHHLLAVLILFCEISNPRNLFDMFWKSCTDDILHQLTSTLGVSNTTISENYLKNKVLIELEKNFDKICSSLANFDLPQPNNFFDSDINNRLLFEELNYDIHALKEKHTSLLKSLNIEQRKIYDDVICSVVNQNGQLFFVHGYGGTGKTYLYETIISYLRSKGKIVLAVASSGIASLLLSGGRTAHSRFKIPLNINEHSTCDIKKDTQLARLIEETCLVVWDESPICHRHCFEALDRTFRDILSNLNYNA